jgi:hypothetical protein
MEIGLGIVFTSVGLLCLLFTVILFRRSVVRLRDWESTVGRIVGHEERRPEGKLYFHPQTEFTARNGRSMVFTASAGSRRRAYRVGAEVRVLVDPANPERADLQSFTTLWLLPLLLTVFALAFMGAGVYLLAGKTS